MLAGNEKIWYLIPAQEEGKETSLLLTEVALGCCFPSHTQGQR